MFALVDCNNFYASCERVFNPGLNGKSIVVLSNNDGCIIARSNEAKALGIKMGQPAFEIEPVLKKYHVTVFSSNYTLYGDMSQRVMNTLGEFTPNIEIYSIDEAFLDLSGFRFDLADYGEKIRYTVGRNTGMPVSVGIAPTKTLAKIANHVAKEENRGVFVLGKDLEAVLKRLPVGEIWGIGGRYAEFLNRHKIFSALDYVQAPDNWIKKYLSVVGLRTKKELMGISCIPLELVPPAKKAICTSRSFGRLLKEYDLVEEAIANHAASCAYKLRKQACCANLIMVFVHTNQFRKQDKQYAKNIVLRLPVPSNSSIELVKYAKFGLKKIFKPGYNYKKAGVIVSGIAPDSQSQQSLFDRVNRIKHQKVMEAMDKINDRYGRAKVRIGTQGTERKWKLKQEQLSPCYTTQWNDLITIKV